MDPSAGQTRLGHVITGNDGKYSMPGLKRGDHAIPAMQPYLNAYPIPNGADNPVTGVAQFNASFSNTSNLDSYSLRIDHRWSDSLSLFGRYNYSPSTLNERSNQTGGQTANDVTRAQIVTQTATVGATWLLSPLISNDFRFNYLPGQTWRSRRPV